MKYYIYGTRELPSKYGYKPAGYLSKESYEFRCILAAMEKAQYKYQMHLKIGVVDNFNDTLIYDNKKSDKEITEHGLTFVGTAEWEFDSLSVFLTLNKELIANNITFELTEVECQNLLLCFRDLTHYGGYRDLRHLYMGDREMARSTLSRLEKILEEVEE
ncbi:hypothetical protein [Anaerococcus marasmi]|uniref:hypothetical protein n=1 Tax=Anaerococcus marasmi TaxID=2057797 RepID=UPI000CF85333|nr:hypothetical protein [Anaerococcus marasmi]